MILDAEEHRPKEGGPSFSLSNRMHRAVWMISWWAIAAWTPPFLRCWRRVVLRLFGAKISSTANVYGSAKIWLPRNLRMDEHSCLGPDVICYNMAPITIEAYATVSQRAHLCAGTHDIDHEAFQLYARPILVKEHAWIAAEAFVGPGVTIGEYAVLGARGVAFKALEPGIVYAGNPAKPIRERRDRLI